MPQARFAFYGTPANYAHILGDALTGRITRGDDVARLERLVAEWVGSPQAVAAPQARVGLYLALKALIRPGQEVVLSPYTIYDVVNMVICAGGRPVFADIEATSCNIATAEVERLIGPDTGAVLVTHLHGLACPIEEIAALCQARGVPLLEDAAQAFGGVVNGRRLGTFGTAGVYSFGRVKNVNALYGGMVVCRDAVLRQAIADMLAAFPLEDTGKLLKRAVHCLVTDIAMTPPAFPLVTFPVLRQGCLRDIRTVNKVVQTESSPVRRDVLPPGYQRRMTPMQARLAARQIARVDADSAERIRRAEAYHEGLSGLAGVSLPPLRHDRSHIYLAYPVQVADRWRLVKHLMRQGRDVAVQHIANAADLPVFADFARDCPVARQVADSVVLLPTYPGYRLSEVKATIASIRDYVATSTAS